MRDALERRGVRKLYPLALELGVDESALSRWRRGGAMSLESAVRLAMHLDISLDWLLTGRGVIDSHKPARPASPLHGELLSRLTPGAIPLLIAFLDAMGELDR